jgi:hypothetical protein
MGGLKIGTTQGRPLLKCRGSNPAAPTSQSVSNASNMRRFAQKLRRTARFRRALLYSGSPCRRGRSPTRSNRLSGVRAASCRRESRAPPRHFLFGCSAAGRWPGPGWTTLLWTAALFLAVEPIVGHVIEPMLYGHSIGLSPRAPARLRATPGPPRPGAHRLRGYPRHRTRPNNGFTGS